IALLAHSERLADSPALPADDDALEHLDTFLGALDDLDVHVDGVARAEGRDIVAQRRLIDEVQPVHERGTSLGRGFRQRSTRGRGALTKPMGSGSRCVSQQAKAVQPAETLKTTGQLCQTHRSGRKSHENTAFAAR